MDKPSPRLTTKETKILICTEIGILRSCFLKLVKLIKVDAVNYLMQLLQSGVTFLLIDCFSDEKCIPKLSLLIRERSTSIGARKENHILVKVISLGCVYEKL